MDNNFCDIINYNIRRNVWAVVGSDSRFDGERLRVWNAVRNFNDIIHTVQDEADERG
jgi:hypothetical protein